MQRFREELERTSDLADAVATTLDTAGRAVWVSVVAVIVSMIVLLIVQVPLLRRNVGTAVFCRVGGVLPERKDGNELRRVFHVRRYVVDTGHVLHGPRP